MTSNFGQLAPPWIPDYAFPDHVLQEPLDRGANGGSRGLPEGTIDDLPGDSSPTWDSGYALPAYIEAEGAGDEPATTGWLPRGWAQALPSPFAGDEGAGAIPKLGGKGDPIGAVARGSAAYLVRTLHSDVPAEWRMPALRYLLDELEPGLFGRVEELSRELKSRGVPSRQALERALASEMTVGIAREIVSAGETGAVPQGGILSVGAHPGRADEIALGAYQELEGLWDQIKRPFKWVGRKTEDGAKSAWSWSKRAANKIADGTCWLVDRKHAATVGAIAGAAIGGASTGGGGVVPGAAAGSAGTKALQQICPDDIKELPPELQQLLMDNAVEPQAGANIPWVPIAAGVGVLAVVIALSR